eukprot:366196-Chlamydomonas_euryale.AAC.7
MAAEMHIRAPAPEMHRNLHPAPRPCSLTSLGRADSRAASMLPNTSSCSTAAISCSSVDSSTPSTSPADSTPAPKPTPKGATALAPPAERSSEPRVSPPAAAEALRTGAHAAHQAGNARSCASGSNDTTRTSTPACKPVPTPASGSAPSSKPVPTRASTPASSHRSTEHTALSSPSSTTSAHADGGGIGTHMPLSSPVPHASDTRDTAAPAVAAACPPRSTAVARLHPRPRWALRSHPCRRGYRPRPPAAASLVPTAARVLACRRAAQRRAPRAVAAPAACVRTASGIEDWVMQRCGIPAPCMSELPSSGQHSSTANTEADVSVPTRHSHQLSSNCVAALGMMKL